MIPHCSSRLLELHREKATTNRFIWDSVEMVLGAGPLALFQQLLAPSSLLHAEALSVLANSVKHRVLFWIHSLVLLHAAIDVRIKFQVPLHHVPFGARGKFYGALFTGELFFIWNLWKQYEIQFLFQAHLIYFIRTQKCTKEVIRHFILGHFYLSEESWTIFPCIPDEVWRISGPEPLE